MARIVTTTRVALAGLAGLGLAYALFPRHPDLRAFDPDRMALAETAMWRHYYDKSVIRAL